MSRTTKWILGLCILSWFTDDAVYVMQYFIPAVAGVKEQLYAGINRIALNVAFIYCFYRDWSEKHEQ